MDRTYVYLSFDELRIKNLVIFLNVSKNKIPSNFCIHSHTLQMADFWTYQNMPFVRSHFARLNKTYKLRGINPFCVIKQHLQTFLWQPLYVQQFWNLYHTFLNSSQTKFYRSLGCGTQWHHVVVMLQSSWTNLTTCVSPNDRLMLSSIDINRI